MVDFDFSSCNVVCVGLDREPTLKEVPGFIPLYSSSNFFVEGNFHVLKLPPSSLTSLSESPDILLTTLPIPRGRSRNRKLEQEVLGSADVILLSLSIVNYRNFWLKSLKSSSLAQIPVVVWIDQDGVEEAIKDWKAEETERLRTLMKLKGELLSRKRSSSRGGSNLKPKDDGNSQTSSLSLRIGMYSVAKKFPITSVEIIEDEVRSTFDDGRGVRIVRMATSPLKPNQIDAENILVQVLTNHAFELYQINNDSSRNKRKEQRQELWTEWKKKQEDQLIQRKAAAIKSKTEQPAEDLSLVTFY